MNKSNRYFPIGIVFLATVLVHVVGSLVLSQFTMPETVRLVAGQLLLVVPTAIYLYRTKQNPLKALRIRKIKISSALLLVVLTFIMLPVLALCNAISMLFADNIIAGEVSTITQGVPVIVSIILIALIPCILEESVYRGMFYGKFSEERPVAAMILSGCLFGLMHMNFNQFVYAFALGCFLPLVVEATDSLVGSMVVHFTINANSTFWLCMIPRMQKLLQEMLVQAKDSGDMATAKMIEESGLASDNLMANAVNSMSTDKTALLASIRVYGVLAVIALILGFFILKKIATNQGTWEKMCEMFSTKQEKSDEKECVGQPAEELTNGTISRKKEHLVTLPLVIGMVICFGIMLAAQLG